MLYIHTSRYSITVDKVKFVTLDYGPKGNFYRRILPIQNSKYLCSIYCYQDGVIRYTFCDEEGKRTRLEFKNANEDALNQLIERYLQKENKK